MNFLFLTTMMILIFTLVSTSMTKNLRTSTLISYHLEKQMEKSYAYHNRLEKTKYNNSKKSTKKTNKQRAELRASKKYDPRNACSGENSKLNLYHFAYGKLNLSEEKLIQKTVTNLLLDLYSNTSIFKESESKSFISTFTYKLLKGLKKSKSLAKIPFEEQKDRELYLVLCNGESKKSTISLLKYLTLQKIDQEAFIVFPALSFPILKALFGDKLAGSIIAKEKERYYEGKAISRLQPRDFENIIFDTKYEIHKNLITHKRIKFKQTQAHLPSEMGSLLIVGPPETLPPSPFANTNAL